jgi:hypothetical protein
MKAVRIPETSATALQIKRYYNLGDDNFEVWQRCEGCKFQLVSFEHRRWMFHAFAVLSALLPTRRQVDASNETQIRVHVVSRSGTATQLRSRQ